MGFDENGIDAGRHRRPGKGWNESGNPAAGIGTRDKKRREVDALVYLVAYDLSDYRLGYALGARAVAVGQH
jgi:hypothetical protein